MTGVGCQIQLEVANECLSEYASQSATGDNTHVGRTVRCCEAPSGWCRP